MELERFLRTLSEDLLYQLILITHVGRGVLGPHDLARTYEDLKSSPANSAWAVPELMRKASLAGELSDGLDQFKKHEINVDRLPLKRTKVRK